jgi:hypothetical protein
VLADTVFVARWLYIVGFMTAVNVIRHTVVSWQTQCLVCDGTILSAS